jgi:hypothetical protein
MPETPEPEDDGHIDFSLPRQPDPHAVTPDDGRNSPDPQAITPADGMPYVDPNATPDKGTDQGTGEHAEEADPGTGEHTKEPETNAEPVAEPVKEDKAAAAIALLQEQVPLLETTGVTKANKDQMIHLWVVASHYAGDPRMGDLLERAIALKVGEELASIEEYTISDLNEAGVFNHLDRINAALQETDGHPLAAARYAPRLRELRALTISQGAPKQIADAIAAYGDLASIRTFRGHMATLLRWKPDIRDPEQQLHAEWMEFVYHISNIWRYMPEKNWDRAQEELDAAAVLAMTLQDVPAVPFMRNAVAKVESMRRRLDNKRAAALRPSDGTSADPA